MYLLLLLPLVGLKKVTCDAAQDWQLGFQDPATPVMEGVINFHNDLMIVVV